MKKTIIVLALAALLPAGMLCAQVNPAKPAAPSAGLKITKITGTVNIMKDGMVVMTLKPGDAIPALVDSAMSFSVVDGSIEVEAGGKTMSASTGANFTVNADNGAEVRITVDAGAPVEIKGAQGGSIVLAQNSEVVSKNDGATVNLAVEKGSAMVMTASGEAPQTLTAGQSFDMPAAPPAPVAAQPAGDQPAGDQPAGDQPAGDQPAGDQPAGDMPGDIFIPPPPPPLEPVIPTQEVQESCEVSGSTPGCN